jgi:spore coat polysaccharide biosynthesis protein SpsF (cytidylyltransferase family)
MKTGILILVRLGSTRLANKHLLAVNGGNFLSILIDRFYSAFFDQGIPVIIATSDLPENQRLKEYVDPEKAIIFFGDDANIPKRQLQCAANFGLSHIISVDGDDILCSTSAAQVVLEKLGRGAEGVKTTGLPIGLNIMGYKVDFLKSCLASAANEGVCEKIETGWGRIFNDKLQEIQLESSSRSEHNDDLRFTLDYAEDERFFRRTIEEFPGDIITASDDELIDFVLLREINKENSFLREEYDRNFNAQKNKEITSNDK